ncbi:hypothetical protein [Polaribacter sp. Hel1_85]|uniref:hypothetical protein n=1 Tax=Polaribacter sp. Hel1_85 TaxID=1250005 RepID=UPI00052D9EFF|nr:hypothetical protein [Polaribacter sp. Hel1_85]KGL64087.1 hypothetical protein PHEL85_1132 [Polaribacter sp. Hel1_85]
MKKIKSILLIATVIIASLSMNSCSSNDDGLNEMSENELFLNFTLNDEETKIVGDFEVISVFSGDNFMYLSINGNNGLQINDPDYIRLSLIIPNKNVAPGTYSFSGDVFTPDLYHCRLIVDGTTIQSLNSGNLIVTSNTGGIIEGTFSGTATLNNEVYTITNGSFKAISNDN